MLPDKDLTRLGPLGVSVALRLIAVVALVVPLAPRRAVQSQLPRFERTDCPVDGDWARDVRRECGWLIVPESRDHPSARTVRLAVEIFRARELTGAPPRVFLHGGPGGAGGIRLYSEAIARSPHPLHRDVVIYDQRGAGLSEPKLCPGYDAAPDTTLIEARRACITALEAQGVDRRAYNTATSVADLIDLRRTLGYRSWDVYGVSYGARLAQEAMARDPDGIHSVVLASPTARSFSSQAEQPLSTQRALERVFAACGQQPSCRDAFPNITEDFYALADDLRSVPVPVPILGPDRAPDTVRFDGARLVADIRNRFLNRPRMGVARLPLLLHELRAGDRMRAAREIVGDGSRDPPDRALRALINCSDRATSGAAYRRTLDSVNAVVRPAFRRIIDRECEDWLPHLGDGSMPAPVGGDIPTLILTGYLDDRTPTEHARRIAATLSRAYLVEFPDEGHDTRPSACHASVVMQFLEDPTRRPDTACVAAIPPIPFATAWEPARDPRPPRGSGGRSKPALDGRRGPRDIGYVRLRTRG
jgi:pimeloyl-ACP methyl ester carboxylesterase